MASQMPLLPPESAWQPPQDFPNLSSAKLISIDVETNDVGISAGTGPSWRYANRGHMAGIAVACPEPGAEWYFPFGHAEGDQLMRKAVLRWASDTFGGNACPKVMFNGQYDLGWLRREGVTVNGPIIDPMGAAALLDEARMSYSLEALCQQAGIPGKDDTLLKQVAAMYGSHNHRADMFRWPAKYTGSYAETDARRNLDLWEIYRHQLRDQNMMDVFRLEMDLYPTWVDMSWQGVRIDQPWVEQQIEEVDGMYRATLDEIARLVRSAPDIWSAESLAGAFASVGVTGIPLTAKTRKPSITKTWLAAQPHPLAALVLRARKLSKVNDTFFKGMITQHLDDRGYIHPEWNPLKNDRDQGVVTGRASSSNPSAQVFPKRDPDFGWRVRGAFLPDEGCEWVSADQAQQEPRWFVHFANASKCHGVQPIVERYLADPDTDYHSECASLSGLPRKQTKDMNQGLAYGMGKAKLIEGLMAMGVSRSKAESVYEQFHERMPYVRQLTDQVARRAGQRGWVKSVLGRRYHFDLWEPENNFQSDPHYVQPLPRKQAEQAKLGEHEHWKHHRTARLVRAFTYRACNRIIQGSSADQIKMAMRDLANEPGIRMTLQVHDELTFSNAQNSEAGRKLIKERMEQAIPASIPFRVDVEVGDRWLAKENT